MLFLPLKVFQFSTEVFIRFSTGVGKVKNRKSFQTFIKPFSTFQKLGFNL